MGAGRTWLHRAVCLALIAMCHSASRGRRAVDEERERTAVPPLQEFKIFLNEPAQPVDETEYTAVAYSSRNERPLLQVLQDQLNDQSVLLSQLKDSLTGMLSVQTNQQRSIDDIYKKIHDNSWAVSSLKASQELLQTNYAQIKEQFDKKIETQEQGKDNLSKAIEQLSNELTLLGRAHVGATKVIRHLIVEGITNDSLASSVGEQDSQDSDSDGDSDGKLQTDRALASSEEETNAIERQHYSWDKVEQTLRHSLAVVRQDLRRHEDELQGLRSVLYDTAAHTLRMQQEQQALHNVSILVAINETADVAGRVTALEQRISALSNDREKMTSMESALTSAVGLTKVTAEQLAELQQFATDQSTLGQVQYDSLTSQLSYMNRTLRALSEKELTSLYSNVTTRTNFVKERNDMLWSQIRVVDSRLAQVEVRYLREQIVDCKRTKEDLTDKLRIRDVEDELRVIMDRVRAQGESHLQVEKLLTRLESHQKLTNESIIAMYGAFSPIIRDLPHFQRLVADVESLLSNLPQDCTDEYMRGSRGHGAYLVRLANSSVPFKVQCMLGEKFGYDEKYTEDEGNAWLLVHRRMTGQTSFDRTWAEYKAGFGDLDGTGDFWLGNERIHRITMQADYSVRFDLWTNGTYYYAEYDHLRIYGEKTNYKLEVRGKYEGNATNSLIHSDNMPFSTKDVDNDSSSTHCAAFYLGGWWYKHCHYCNLNGRIPGGMVWFHREMEEWMDLTSATMMLRRHST